LKTKGGDGREQGTPFGAPKVEGNTGINHEIREEMER